MGAPILDTLLDIQLDNTLEVEEATVRDINEVLDQLVNTIEIIAGEVERIRIATGTAPPP